MIIVRPFCEPSTYEEFEVNPTIFPDGTSQVFLPPRVQQVADLLIIEWNFEEEREIMDLASIRKGLQNFAVELELSYLPYARQDKIVTYKTPSTFNLAAFAMLLNAMHFHQVTVIEPHNIEETERLIERCKVIRKPFVSPSLQIPKEQTTSIVTIVFPDKGALSRYGKNQELQGFPLLVFDKSRDQATGAILSSHANFEAWKDSIPENPWNEDVKYTFQIVDDLVDGGASFKHCAQAIRSWMSQNMDHVIAQNVQVQLEVMHGVLSAGEPISGIDEIRCHNRLLHPCNENPLLHTDGYKLAHMEQYPPNTEYIYSYMITRRSKKYSQVCFFGLQYYLLNYLSGRVTRKMVNEFIETREALLGPTSDIVREQMEKLIQLQYLPLRIKAVPEGSTVDVGNALVTVTNTEPGYFWLVGLVESLLLKVWYTSTVATFSQKLWKLCEDYGRTSCDNCDYLPYQVHDFGYRGVSSEESDTLGGAAHLLHFRGSDTVPAISFAKKWYGAACDAIIGSTVPGTEHSVMCSYGREQELEAYQRILEAYPTGNVSIVSDTYDYWKVLTEFLPALKDQIMARKDGKVIIRPDSGNPEHILLGDPNEEDKESPKYLGTLRILDQIFGSTLNSHGLKILHPSIGVIYGDGMYYERIERVLGGCRDIGFEPSSVSFGCGGILLQNHQRDDLGFAFKATSVTIDGKRKAIFKDPVTDHSKKSHHGLMRVEHDKDFGKWTTFDDQSEEQEEQGELRTVFENGRVFRYDTFEEIGKRARARKDTEGNM